MARLFTASGFALSLAMATPAVALCDFDAYAHRAALNNPSSIEQLKLRVHRGPAWYLKQLRNAVTGQVDETPLPATLTVRYSFGACDWEASVLGRDNSPPTSLEASPFDVSLPAGRVLNANRFRLHYAPGDALTYDIVVTAALRKLGFIAPETFALEATLGGRSGRFVFQEHIGKPMLERNRRPYGPMFNTGRSTGPGGRFSLTRMVNPHWAARSDANLSVATSALLALQSLPSTLDTEGPVYFNRYTQSLEPILSGRDAGRRLVAASGAGESAMAAKLAARIRALRADEAFSKSVSLRLALSKDRSNLASDALATFEDAVTTAVSAGPPLATRRDTVSDASISTLTLQGGRLATGFAGIVTAPDGRRIHVELSALDVIKVLSGNGLNGQPVVLADTVDPRGKAHLNKIAFSEGDILHSDGAVVAVDTNAKTVAIQQASPTDWAVIRGATLEGWNVIFFGTPQDEESLQVKPVGPDGCLTFYDTDFFGSSIISLDGACAESVSLVSSRGQLDLLAVENGFNHAIGIDLSDIEIDELLVTGTGGDCLAVSGARTTIRHAQLDVCGETGIAVGDNSDLMISDAKVQSQELGVSAWGLSIAHIESFAPSEMSPCGATDHAPFVIGATNAEEDRTKCHAGFEHETGSEIVIGALREEIAGFGRTGTEASQ